MSLAKQVLLIFSLFFWASLACANSDKTLVDKLDAIEALIASQPDQAIIAIEKVKKNKTQLTSKQQVQLIEYEALANTYLNRYELALNIIEEIKEIANLEGNKAFLWQYYGKKAIIYWYMDSIEESLAFHLMAYDVVKSIEKFSHYQAISEGNIGYAYLKLGFFQQAISYFEPILVLAKTTDNAINLATAYNNLGEAYLGLKNYQKSFELLDKSLAIRIKHQLTFHSSFSYHNLGLIYYARKEYQQAETVLLKAIEIREQAGFIKGSLVSNLILAKVYFANNKTALAEKELEVIIAAAKNQNNDTILSKAYDLQRKVHANKKEYQRAYQTSLNYEQVLEQVVSRKTSAKLANYLNNSEAISKDLNILELEKNAEIKTLQMNSERQNTKIIIISSFCILIVLAFFLWSVQKSKKAIAKSNENLSLTLTQLKQTQEKLVKSGKMSALTTLVSRMAHQINTPLGVAVTGVSHIHEKVAHFGQLIEKGVVKKSEIHSFIADLNTGCQLSSSSMDKIADLVSQFKMISDNLEAETQQEFEMFDLISKQADLTLILHKKHKPIINISGSKVLMLGYPEALNKIFNQLITNSIDHAFEETLTPKIDVEIVKVNDYVEITYQDNGKGIDATIVNDVFEPFYTTNMGNKNLGIGLSIVYNLVVQLMHGNIQYKPKQGKGIMFFIRFPLTVKAV